MTLNIAEEPRRSPKAEAMDALQALKIALDKHAILLPTLELDTYSSLVPTPLIALGRCNAQTARALAAVLEAAHVR
ncbi:hypothetical protein [Streptomyces sp. SBT349]|uniref:hypothetical protein n=1 Tax=Streptomyces sp. SBT349 TaxID=1580539 RepID=UPI00066A480D|nr:hypothetical protein [Streptomyces sp. SBT349]